MNINELISTYIDDDAGPSRAWVRGYGVDVWALVAYLQVVGGDRQRVAEDYELPNEAIDAVLAYYDRHRNEIDARIRLNTAA